MSVSRLCAAENQHEVRVFTRDREHCPGSRPFGFPRRVFVTDGAVEVAYVRINPLDLAWVIHSLRRWKPDLYYINSLHGKYFAILPLLLLRLGIAPRSVTLLNPRGETSPGSQSMKPWKKRFGKPLLRALVGRRAVWHAAAQHEEHDIRRWLGRTGVAARVLVQGNFPAPPTSAHSQGSGMEALQVAFASRIHPTKGLREALEILGKSRVDMDFTVHGPIEDSDYWNECRVVAERYRKCLRMSYKGEYDSSDTTDIFGTADLAILLSRGESFGHAIAEALATGCPVAISANTPWTDFVNADCGLASNDPVALSTFLRDYSQSSDAARLAHRKEIHRRYSDWYRDNLPNVSIFSKALRVGSRPLESGQVGELERA